MLCTMRVDLPFGKSTVTIDVPDSATVLRPAPAGVVADPGAAVRALLAAPTAGPALSQRYRRGQRVALVISDITRPVPNRVLLPPIIGELEAAGARDEDIVVVNGTGLHRPNSEDVLRWMLGEELCRRFRIVQHEARRPETLVRV